MSDLVALREHWHGIVAEHVPRPDDRRRCARCGAYWPCWELAYARQQITTTDGRGEEGTALSA